MRFVPIPTRGCGWLRVLAAGLAVVAVGACGSGADEAAGGAERLTVVAGLHPLAEVAERVGGARVDVVDLTPAGSEPHDLELVPDQVEDLQDADLVLVLGRGFQPAVEQVAARRDGPTVVLLDELSIAGGGVDDHGDEAGTDDDDGDGGAAGDRGHEGDDHGDEAGVDPHVWLDPTLMARIVDEVTAALVALDPDGAASFESAATAYREELAALDVSYRERLGACRGATIVVAHEAFGWLAARYGLVQQGISGLTPGAEPSPARMAELADLVRDEGVTTVFTETLVSPRVAEALAREAGVGTAVLDPLEGMTDEQQAAGETYVSVMEDNLAALADALPCAQAG